MEEVAYRGNKKFLKQPFWSDIKLHIANLVTSFFPQNFSNLAKGLTWHVVFKGHGK